MENPAVPEPPVIPDQRLQSVSAPNDGEHVLLRILSPSPEVPGGQITFRNIHLNHTLLQLKNLIQESLAAAPARERQRLIYRGHALLNLNVTLRSIFRPPGSIDHSDSYTLHLVLPPGNYTAPFSGVSSHSIVEQAPPTPPLPSGPPANQNPPQLPVNQLLLAAEAQAQAVRNQLNILQQHNAHHYGLPQYPANAYPGAYPGTYGSNNPPINNAIPPGTNPWATPGGYYVPGMYNAAPHGMQMVYQMQGPPAQGPEMQQGGWNTQEAPFSALFQYHIAQNPQFQPPGHTGNTNSQPAFNVPQMASQQPPNAPSNPSIHSQSTTTPTIAQPSPFSATTRVHEAVGPQGQRIRTVIRESGSLNVSRNQPHSPIVRAASIPGDTAGLNIPTVANLVQRNMTPQELQARVNQARENIPPPAVASLPATASASDTMAWVLASPTGPQALLFAPGHGYFSSSRRNNARPSPTRTSRGRHGAGDTAQAQPPNVPAAQADDPAQPAAQVVVRQQDQNQNGVENEMLPFLVQRAWLFLRLYIFTFFLSDPGTWQRYILLGIATFICMLPRQNALNDLLRAIRRHVDGLIGPATPAARPAADAQAGVVAQPGTGGTPSAGTPSPEETAARLLREHQVRNPSILRDILFRLERGMALFLASLIPGVGERHVRAREDARREAQRVENERREAAERERTQREDDANTAEVADAVGSGQSESSAVQAERAEQLRERNTAQAVETAA